MALVCLCRGNFYWPPHTTILFCSIFLDKIVLDTLKSRYHRSAPLGMALALRKNCEFINEMTMKLRRMETSFFQALRGSGIDFLRNGGKERIPGNINISIRGTDGEMLLHRMDLKGICISTGSACDSVNTQISHVIQAINVPAEYAKGTVRISFGKDNQESDAQSVASALIEILKK